MQSTRVSIAATRSVLTVLLGSVLLGSVLGIPGHAHAHGGIHESEGLGEVGSPGSTPDVVTNYGLLTPVGSRDWAWICEEVVSTQGFTAWLELDGRWLIGEYDGLYTSEDRCDWPLQDGLLSGLYVTGLYQDTTTTNRVWATTATAKADNALFVSDDGGQSWSEFASMGVGSTLRGMAQAPEGLPIFAVGWLEDRGGDVVPEAWITTDGDTWQAHPLPADSVYSVGVLGYADGAAWLRAAGASTDTLLRLDADGTTTSMLELDDVITAFDSGPDAGTLYVGGKVAGLLGSSDGGTNWSTPVLSPEPGCLESRGDERYICSQNWADGAALQRTTRVGGDSSTWTWQDVLWFGDVHGVLDCPAGSDVAEVCDPLWEKVKAEAGFDLESTGDTGADSGGDGGATDDTGTNQPTDGGCCKGSAAGLVFLPGLLGVAGIRRRR